MFRPRICRYTIYFLLLLLLFVSCGANKSALNDNRVADLNIEADEYVAEEASGMPMLRSSSRSMNAEAKESKSVGRSEVDASIERRLIKNGYISFETTDIKTSRSMLGTLITKYEAYISSEDESSSNSRIEINLTVKIPKDNFDSFLAEIENAEKGISSKNIDIQDVTEEFVDITARLAVKKETEQTYLRLLSTAKTVRDVLDIQDQIQNLRSEIEGIEGRLKYLEKAVAYSTLNMRMYQFVAKANYLPPRVSFFRRAFASLKQGINIFAEVIIAVLNVWLFIFIAVIIGLFVRWIVFKRKRENKGDQNGHK